MTRFLDSASAEGTSKDNLAICATTICQIDPKMMRFLKFVSAEGASEENLAIYARSFCQIDPKNDVVVKFRERRRRERRKFGDLCEDFLPN